MVVCLTLELELAIGVQILNEAVRANIVENGMNPSVLFPFPSYGQIGEQTSFFSFI